MLSAFIFFFGLWLSSNTASASERVRHVVVAKDQIVTVRTAIGIATIVQVPDHPNSVVVGDQDSFKVEYLDQAITIKPLKAGAKSNLYVYTDWQRYNVQLITGPESIADFVVYLDHPEHKPDEVRSALRWHDINRNTETQGIRVDVVKAATTPDMLLIQFEVTASGPQKIDPSWIWITQGKSVRPINSLVLSNVDLTSTSKINGMIQIKRSDFKEKEPLKFELRRKHTAFVMIPQVSSWKR
jgi:Conjugal transfer protein